MFFNVLLCSSAWETLGVPAKRRSFDSVDPEFDDTIPDKEDGKEDFYGIYGEAFDRNARLVICIHKYADLMSSFIYFVFIVFFYFLYAHNTIQHNTTQHNAPHRTAPHRTTPHHTTPHHTIMQAQVIIVSIFIFSPHIDGPLTNGYRAWEMPAHRLMRWITSIPFGMTLNPGESFPTLTKKKKRRVKSKLSAFKLCT